MAIQEGVYFQPKSRPGRCFKILFLRARTDVTAEDVQLGLRRLWDLWTGLKAGRVPSLKGVVVPSGNLTVLIGYGVKSFEIPGAMRTVPAALKTFGRFQSPQPTGGGPLLVGSGLAYAPDVPENPATEHIAVQFIADSELAVHRAIVETWRALHSWPEAPLLLGTHFGGFQRDDGRSWLDFHDGISNLRSGDERQSVLEVKPDNAPTSTDAWTQGGTYLAFIRIAVDLALWESLPRNEQEVLVGRTKVTGCPLAEVDAAGDGVPVVGCPVAGTGDVITVGNEAFFEPQDSKDPAVAESHVQRANRHVGAPEQENSLRIFRQGYEFLEPSPAAPGFRAGLNFISFQDTPRRLVRMLTQQGWLGARNFGGTKNPSLLSVRAAGVYFAPKAPPEGFPGEEIFAQ